MTQQCTRRGGWRYRRDDGISAARRSSRSSGVSVSAKLPPGPGLTLRQMPCIDFAQPRKPPKPARRGWRSRGSTPGSRLLRRARWHPPRIPRSDPRRASPRPLRARAGRGGQPTQQAAAQRHLNLRNDFWTDAPGFVKAHAACAIGLEHAVDLDVEPRAAVAAVDPPLPGGGNFIRLAYDDIDVGTWH